MFNFLCKADNKLKALTDDWQGADYGLWYQRKVIFNKKIYYLFIGAVYEPCYWKGFLKDKNNNSISPDLLEPYHIKFDYRQDAWEKIWELAEKHLKENKEIP